MTNISLITIPGPGTWQNLNGLRQQGFLGYIQNLWKIYGDVFRLQIGKRSLVFAIHPENVRQVNITNRQNYDKLHSYDIVRRYLLGNGLLASTGELWRRQRQLMSPFYTPRGVQAYAEIMLRDGARLFERWGKLANEARPVEIGEEMTFVTASIILKAMFSMETNEAVIGMKNAVEAIIGFTASHQAGIVLPLWLPTRVNHQYKSARQVVHTYIIERR